MNIWYLYAVLIVIALIYTFKDNPWLFFKLNYLKRKTWNSIGRCHKCKRPLSYTPKGRGICTENGCR